MSLLITGTLVVCSFAMPEDASMITQGMEAIISFLDSSEYSAIVSWDEHVVLTYKIVQKRAPTLSEFHVLKGLHKDNNLKRSDVLALVLRNDKNHPTWEKCRDFLAGFNKSLFNSNDETRLKGNSLSTTSPEAVAKSMASPPVKSREAYELLLKNRVIHDSSEPDEQYNTYFGFLHAHSHLSRDAEGSPLEAYKFARDEGGLDFFALTDHAEFMLLWPWLKKWDKLVDAAEATNEPGEYVALWGFEWSNPLLGHINIINTTDFTDSLATFSLTQIYEWLAARPEGFGRFNHPGDYDYLEVEFAHFRLHARAVPQMVGLELWNTNSSFDELHYDGSYNSDLSFMDAANEKGWELGALGAQDNHNKEWGTLNQFRTGVQSKELTREAILDAYKRRRIYATEDKDLILDFRSNGYPMGSVLKGLARNFEITARDNGTDTFNQIKLYRDGELLDTVSVSGNPVSATFTDDASSEDAYYYVIVTQDDDNDDNGRNDEAISSPIWFDEENSNFGCNSGKMKTKSSSTKASIAIFASVIIILLHARRKCLPAGIIQQ